MRAQDGFSPRLNSRGILPLRKGPEDRHDFASFEERDSAAFNRFNPFASAPSSRCTLAPLRDDVPLTDPCCGWLSAATLAERRLQAGSGPEEGEGISAPATVGAVPLLPSDVTLHRFAATDDENRGWNSRAVSEASVRARLGGWTSPVRVFPVPPRSPCTLSSSKFFFTDSQPATEALKDSSLNACRDNLAKRYIYTSATQRSYEDVPWESKLPQKINPPDTTLEVMADPISQCFTLRRYEAEPEVWQSIGSAWDRMQLRTPNTVRKPITFISPSVKSLQIPLYSGSVGGENLDDIDNPEKEFSPFTVLRTTKPRYTDTAHRPNIPGYTGRVLITATTPSNSKLPSPPTTADTYRYIITTRNQSPYRRLGYFSRMVTTVTPCNPFRQTEREVI
ncbi:spermatogenesis-associated protein 48 isoform X1 [Erpetoichthys calabaricus]|uniref:Sperm microtubule inner protein 7 n=1 Tax=Erpetoichthys calabaricus TaxID=27687 RepID=A0A8C4T0Q4_ERPCA|nr:spermatogenesis-associated protein 48 isoform X1 [Erpetoichthys calabaricus]